MILSIQQLLILVIKWMKNPYRMKPMNRYQLRRRVMLILRGKVRITLCFLSHVIDVMILSI